MQFRTDKLVLICFICVYQTQSQNHEVCLSIPPGPAGPPGPPGPPGTPSECHCNNTEIEEELETQRGKICFARNKLFENICFQNQWFDYKYFVAILKIIKQLFYKSIFLVVS